MTSTPTIRVSAAPDQSRRAQHIINSWLLLDPEVRNRNLARLIAATLHGGPHSALHAFAAIGKLDREACIEELNRPFWNGSLDDWADALGRHFFLADEEDLL